jgi:hypothetical protein
MFEIQHSYSVYSRSGDSLIFLRITPIFSEAGENFKERRKKSTNVINSHFSIQITPVFLIIE